LIYQPLTDQPDALLHPASQNNFVVSYIDELVQVALNQDPQNATTGTTENLCELFYWTLCDANYNVLGLINQSGQLIERYEYTAYGKRRVFSHGRVLGDTDEDGDVDATDQSTFTAENDGVGESTSICDYDGDGDVDAADEAIIDAVSYFQKLWTAAPG